MRMSAQKTSIKKSPRKPPTGSCAKCSKSMAATPPLWTPTPRAPRESFMSGTNPICARCSAPTNTRRWNRFTESPASRTLKANGISPRTPTFEKDIGNDGGADANPALISARKKLLEERGKRVRPALDDKILTAWNGLMIRGMARAALALGRDYLADSAARALGFCPRKFVARRPPAGHHARRPRQFERALGRLRLSCRRHRGIAAGEVARRRFNFRHANLRRDAGAF